MVSQLGWTHRSDATPVAGQQFEYAFDDIGNRTSAKIGGDESGSNLRSASYTPNPLNHYTSRTVPGYAEMFGTAASNATVTVNLLAPYRKGPYFLKELTAVNASAPVWLGVTNVR